MSVSGVKYRGIPTMNIERGRDGSWCASGKGYLRPIVADGASRKEAVANYGATYLDQQNEEVAFVNSMGALSDQLYKINYEEGL